jgi:hypothetical protein
VFIESTNHHSILLLRVVRYEYPEHTQTNKQNCQFDWDANWLVLLGEITNQTGMTLSFTKSCLTTLEAIKLGHWLQHADQFSGYTRLQFTEPYLQFSATHRGSLVTLSVKFQSGTQYGVNSISTDISIDVKDLVRAGKQWLAELECFPLR